MTYTIQCTICVIHVKLLGQFEQNIVVSAISVWIISIIIAHGLIIVLGKLIGNCISFSLFICTIDL